MENVLKRKKRKLLIINYATSIVSMIVLCIVCEDADSFYKTIASLIYIAVLMLTAFVSIKIILKGY